MTRAPIAWVLNLDADVELGAGRSYQPTRAIRAAMGPHAARLASSLLAPGDVLIDETSNPGAGRGLVGRAFCPTPRAIEALLHAGAVPEPHPSRDVLALVNGRRFCASLGQSLPDSEFFDELEAVFERVGRSPSIGRGWRLKRAFGMAGRGQRVLSGGAPLTEADRTFLRAAIAEGGLQVEPDVPIEQELSLHGMLDREGGLRTGRIVLQECDRRGQWLSTKLASRVPPDVEAAIAREVDQVATALRQAGYFGPFGVDAFLYRDPGEAVRLQPRSEINARYSMGFAVGFGRP